MRKNTTNFHPIFVVGCQRSGTTALAVMLDRHSGIAVPPETQFFVRLEERQGSHAVTHEQRLDRALRCTALGTANLDLAHLLGQYTLRAPTDANLLEVALQCYADERGARRAGEKSCGHLFHVQQIVDDYPTAKIICIVRDGRDVVLSLRKVSWARRIPVVALCAQWKRFSRQARRVQQNLSSETFTMVHFEQLMSDPHDELSRLCRFIGEAFEPGQLAQSSRCGAVPEQELSWKQKATMEPDSSRSQAWRSHPDQRLLRKIEFLLAAELQEWGYSVDQARKPRLVNRGLWTVENLPFYRPIYPISRRLFRSVVAASDLSRFRRERSLGALRR